MLSFRGTGNEPQSAARKRLVPKTSPSTTQREERVQSRETSNQAPGTLAGSSRASGVPHSAWSTPLAPNIPSQNKQGMVQPGPLLKKGHKSTTIAQTTLVPPPIYIAPSSIMDKHPLHENWIKGIKSIKEGLEEGAVILAPYLEPLLDDKIAPGHKDRAETHIGAAIAKHRSYVILAKHELHYSAISLWTHQEQGIDKRTAQFQLENVGVTKRTLKSMQQGPHRPLVLEDTTRWNVKDTCVAHFTELHSIAYSCPVRPLGYITRLSYIRLVELYMGSVNLKLEHIQKKMQEDEQTTPRASECTVAERRWTASVSPAKSLHVLVESTA
ncbi:MAG: hypothetical protein Q9157_002313 [Trypethelium eluteriae]